MKTNFESKALIVATVCASVFALAHALSAPVVKNGNGLQTVTITAQRMSEAQKIAYDRAQMPQQTVIITAKRLTEEQKASFDEAQQATQEYLAANASNAGEI